MWLFKDKKTTVISICILIISIIVVSGYMYYQNNLIQELKATKLNQMQAITLKQEEVNRLIQEKEVLVADKAKTIASYDLQIQEKDAIIKEQQKQVDSSYMLSEYTLDFLSAHASSPQKLIEDLLKQSELIPKKGILGGTMYWIENTAVVLNNRFVFCSYEDGHIMGHALLSYEFDQDQEIKWTVDAFFNE